MSVLIKGMEIPTSCDNCWALDDYGDYIDADTYYHEKTGCLSCDIWFFINEDEKEETTIEKWNRRVKE